MELDRISKLSEINANCLNTEEAAGLEVAMLQRKLQEDLKGNMYFWGKIFGSTQDYLVCFNTNPFDDFPEKKFYFCTTSDYVLRALPHLIDEYKNQAKLLKSQFLGDPSFFAYNGEEEEEAEPEDPEQAPKERFREVHRLSFTVQQIDHDCSIVPRGAISVDAFKRVIFNGNFQGLSYDTSKELRAFMHLRQPENIQGQALLKKPGLLKTDDFLDCIDKDVPKEMWSITFDSPGLNVFVKNLYWEGFVFFATLNNPNYGGAYFGTGVPNYDIAFML